jgi:hypothetical protein
LKAWPTVRALLIGATLLVGLIDGCPVPTDQNLAEEWPRPLVPFGIKLRSAREWLLTPFAWIGSCLAVQQRWSLFSGADPLRFRMWIEAREGEKPWQVLFRPHDPAHRYRADIIQYRRLRGAWNFYRQAVKGGYPYFVDWIARSVFLDATQPHFDLVRVRMERIDASAFVTELKPTGGFEHESVRDRPSLFHQQRP